MTAAPRLMPAALFALLMGLGGTSLAALPVPPVPPANPPVDEAAPVPNPDMREPVRVSAADVTLRPLFYRADRPDTSLGFTPGSRYQANDERKPLQTPGLRLTVPLQAR